MSEQDNVSIVRQAYRRFQEENIPGLLDLFAEDIEWDEPKMEGVGFSGKWHGREAVRQFFTELAQQQEPLQFEPQQFIAQDEKVVTLGHYVWNVRATDRLFESDWVHVFTVRDGRIVQFREFTDTAAGAKAYQPRR